MGDIQHRTVMDYHPIINYSYGNWRNTPAWWATRLEYRLDLAFLSNTTHNHKTSPSRWSMLWLYSGTRSWQFGLINMVGSKNTIGLFKWRLGRHHNRTSRQLQVEFFKKNGTRKVQTILTNGDSMEWSPIRSVIIQVINKIGRPRSGSGRHDVLLPINHYHYNFSQKKTFHLKRALNSHLKISQLKIWKTASMVVKCLSKE